MTRKFRLYGAVLLLLALAASLRADVFQGTVTGVIDGDTMTVLDSLTLTTYTVCFADAEAPLKQQMKVRIPRSPPSRVTTQPSESGF